MQSRQDWKYKLFQRRLKKDLKFRRTNIDRPPVNKAQKIGAVWTETPVKPSAKINRLLKEWEKLGTEITTFCYFPELKKDEEVPAAGIGTSDVNWLGIPKWEKIKSFVDQSFDLFLILDDMPSPPIEYIQYLSAAKFKIGTINNPCESLDLKLESGIDFDLEKFWKDLTFYLDQLSIKT